VTAFNASYPKQYAGRVWNLLLPESAYPEPETVEEVYDFLREIDHDPIELTLDEIRERLNLSIRSEGVSACEKLLENCGALERLDARQNVAAVRIDSDLPTLVDLLPKEAKVQRRVLQAVEKEVGGLRFERVYVNPRRISQAAEIDLAAANRALRELSKLEAFDFVPPFRGRAVHMLVRDKPFEQLGIDFGCVEGAATARTAGSDGQRVGAFVDQRRRDARERLVGDRSVHVPEGGARAIAGADRCRSIASGQLEPAILRVE